MSGGAACSVTSLKRAFTPISSAARFSEIQFQPGEREIVSVTTGGGGEGDGEGGGGGGDGGGGEGGDGMGGGKGGEGDGSGDGGGDGGLTGGGGVGGGGVGGAGGEGGEMHSDWRIGMQRGRTAAEARVAREPTRPAPMGLVTFASACLHAGTGGAAVGGGVVGQGGVEVMQKYTVWVGGDDDGGGHHRGGWAGVWLCA